ncbi:riboflavin-binding protein-like [Ciona intestinalis]
MFGKITVVTILLGLFANHGKSALMSPSCPRGDYQKESPSGQEHLAACKQYTCNSCCFENITTQLAIMPIQQVGKLNYEQCGKLTDACSTQHTYLQCLYQCSPNLYPWMIESTRKLIAIPLCASFCDQWFFTCSADMTCAPGDGNWKTGLNKGFDASGNPVDACQPGVICRNYTETYGSGEVLCNNIWGTLFKYSTDTNNCIDPSNPTHNSEVVKSINSSYTTSICETEVYTDTGMIIGIVFGVLGGIFLIAAGIAFYMRQKKNKKPAGKSAPAKPTSEEMSTLRVQPSADTPPNTREGSDIAED